MIYFDSVRQALCNPDQERILEDHFGRLMDDDPDFCAGAAAGHVAGCDYLPAAHRQAGISVHHHWHADLPDSVLHRVWPVCAIGQDQAKKAE